MLWIKPSKVTGRSVSAVMLGLKWGNDQDRVRSRFTGITPLSQNEHEVEWRLFDIATRLVSEQAFLPTMMDSAPDRDGDRVSMIFVGGAFVSMRITYGYGFDGIGQDPDTLSNQAMAAFARAEWADLLRQMASRYGAPSTYLEGPARMGTWYLIGCALYVRPDGSPVSLRFGHDALGLVGDLTANAPSVSETGL